MTDGQNGPRPGWFERQLKSVGDEVASWPASLKKEIHYPCGLSDFSSHRSAEEALEYKEKLKLIKDYANSLGVRDILDVLYV